MIPMNQHQKATAAAAAGGRVLHLPSAAADHPWPRPRAAQEPKHRHPVRMDAWT